MIDLISSPDSFFDELNVVRELFYEGLKVFHLRKPGWSSAQIESWLNDFGSEFRSEIVLHNHLSVAKKYEISRIHQSTVNIEDKTKLFSTSTHSIQELSTVDGLVEQAFLSPLFDSISKSGYSGKLFDVSDLKMKTLKVALGGIDKSNIEAAFGLGYDKVAVLGAVWNDNPVRSFKEINNVIQ